MIRKAVSRLGVATAILGCAGTAIGAGGGASRAQSAPMTYAETPSNALSRYLRVLATSPRDFGALIGAGKAALALGDSQAAGGFFARADEVSPTSPLPQAGLGAALVADGEATASLAHFARAQQMGASVLTFAADRGLAFDLLGRTAEAQADYRLALNGADANEARRRLALSLAISGNTKEAIDTLAPLMARGDAAAARCRALVLALSGDAAGAKRTLDVSIPGLSASMTPFLARLPSLRPEQKAAAVHLGIFPDALQPTYGYGSTAVASVPQPSAGPATTRPAPAGVTAADRDRLAAIDDLLRGSPASPPPPAAAPVQVANVIPPARAVPTARATTTAAATVPGVSYKRYWVQLASGQNSTAFPEQFQRIKRRSGELLDGIGGYVAQDRDRVRLLVGPFRNSSDASVFAEGLESKSVDAFSWTSPEGLPIRKISTE